MQSGGARTGAYIVAEAGVNHNGSYELACKMVDGVIEQRALHWRNIK